nr:MmgE/PrpD family protein [Lichenifustis flavocetrariae]
MTVLANFACTTQIADLPDSLLQRGRWIIADCIGAVAGGMQTPEMRAFVARHLTGRAAGAASVIGAGVAADPRDAALLNGTAGTWQEQDEGNLHAKGHPGIQVVPAAIAVAQARRLSGADTLLAVLLGYEISARINRASNSRFAFHPHGTYGVLGAAVAVGRLSGYDPDRMRQLLNVAATCGVATSRNTIIEGVTVRNIYTGMSGFNGQLACEMVESGFTGERDGVGSVFGKIYGDGFDSAATVNLLGSEYLTARNYFKIHACGRYAHSALDLIEDWLAEGGDRVDPTSIESVHVVGYSFLASLHRTECRTSFDARFSVPFAIASLIVHGKPGLENFEQPAVDNPAIQALARRVVVTESPEFTKAFPGRQMVEVTVTPCGGKTWKGRGEHTKGEAERPHSPAELRDKFLALTAGAWTQEQSAGFLDGLLTIDAVPDMASFLGQHGI